MLRLCFLHVISYLFAVSFAQQAPNDLPRHFPVVTAQHHVSVNSRNLTPNLALQMPDLPQKPSLVKRPFNSTATSDDKSDDLHLAKLKPIEVLNPLSIRVQGFDHIQRRTVREILDDDVKDQVRNEELLPIEHKVSPLPAVEMFDLSPGQFEGSGSGSGDDEDVSLVTSPMVKIFNSQITLTPEAGFDHVSWKLKQRTENGVDYNGILEAAGSNLKDETIKLDDVELASGHGHSFNQQEPNASFADVQDENVDLISQDSIDEQDAEMETNLLTSEIQVDESGRLRVVPRMRNVDSAQSASDSESRNATSKPVRPRTYDGPIATLMRGEGPIVKFFSDNLAVILGTVLAIPVMILLLYSIHLRRRRGYTGSLNVSPSSIYLQKKRSTLSRGVTICSHENEVSLTPSASTPPKPPPLPKE